MTTTMAIYGSIPASPEEAQERVRALIRNHADPTETQEFMEALGLA